MTVINHIRALEEKRNARISDPLYQNTPIPIPINLGVIEGGNWPSSVPDLVKIEGRMGVAPEETMEQAKDRNGRPGYCSSGKRTNGSRKIRPYWNGSGHAGFQGQLM